MKKMGSRCTPLYDTEYAETDNFGERWGVETNETCTGDAAFCPWHHHTATSLTNPVYIAASGLWYDGGGYVAQWDFTPETARKISKELQETAWLDEHTSAVFVEFTVYNANINLFSFVYFLVEFSPTGNIEPLPMVYTFKLYDYTSAEDVQAITVSLFYVLFVMSLLYFLIREIDDMKRSGAKYLLSAGNWLEICIIACSVLSLVAYMARKISVEAMSLELEDAQEKGTFDLINFI